MMKRLPRRWRCSSGCRGGALGQQPYPNRIIHMMQGFPPGGNVDIIARILATRWRRASASRSWSRPSPAWPARLPPKPSRAAEPDGYTLLVLPSAHPAYGALRRT